MAGQEEQFDLAEKLKQRLNVTKAQKEATHVKINKLNEELQRLFAKIPKKPRESAAELNQKISALEFQRTTTSLILSDEKQILKEIAGIQRQKSQIEEYNSGEAKVQETKAELNNLRDSLKKTTLAIDELEKAIAKVKMAKKLGCAPAELIVVSVDCPAEKVGKVIGKNGATIKQIEERAHVSMDVDSVGCKINLTGSHSSIQYAISKIDRVVKSVDEDIHVSDDLINYMTTKRISLMAEIRKAHPHVQVDALRDKKIVAVRGLPEHVARARQDILNLHLTKDSRTLSGKESAILVGKGGVSINKLVETHEVTIDVDERSDDVFSVSVIGPAERVQSALIEIDSMMEANKDVVFDIPVDQIIRNTMLIDSGAPIKKLQKDVNETITGKGMIWLSFSNDKPEKPTLLIKGRLVAVTEAKDMVEKAISDIKDALITIDVDPFIIPKLIGKGGETIKKIKNGKSVTVEVDKVAGRVVVYAADEAESRRVANEINELLKENQLVRIDYNPALVKRMFLDIRGKKKDEINPLVWMGRDDEASQIVLRGSAENLKKASEIVCEFINMNYIAEVQISAEDEPTLLTGRSESPINKLASEYGVELSINRSKLAVQAKGEKEKVQAAVKRLNQFLHGGDGYTVSRIVVTEQALGVVIGKAGSKRAELERRHEGVNLFIHHSNRITIRGPEANVEACRVDILRLVSSVRIQKVVPLTKEQHEALSKPEAIRRITSGIPVNVTLTEENLKIRGIFADVRDSQALLQEQMTGVYEARVELEGVQLACVRGATRDPSHFNRMKESTGANITLDNQSGAIVISGKRSQVKKAKALVVGFLGFLLPSDFARLTLSKPLHTTVGEAAALAEIAAVSGATVFLDRDLSCIQVQSPDPDKIKKAVDVVKERIESAEKNVFVYTIEHSDQWLIPLIIGKGGNRINSLRLDSGCHIDVDKEERTVVVSSDDEGAVTKAREALMEMIETSRRQCAFVELPEDAIAAFLGRSGSHIRSFANKHQVEVEKLRKDPCKVKITGEEAFVQAAKGALIEWIARWEGKETGLTMEINTATIPVIIGKGGSTITAVQKEFMCRVVIDRDEAKLTIRGSTPHQRQAALAKITEIIEQDRIDQESRRRNNEPNGYHASGDHEETPNQAGRQNGHSNGDDTDKMTNTENMNSLDGRKNRRGQFAARPVGLTIVESKPKKKRNRNKNKAVNNDISDDSTLQVGTTAGRNLFNLLVSESPAANADDDRHTELISNNKVVVTTEDQWDSSTVSSAAIGSDPGDEMGGVTVGSKHYIKSTSGFQVRV